MKQEMKNERRKHIEVRRKLVKKLEYRKLMKKENGIKLNVKYQNQNTLEGIKCLIGIAYDEIHIEDKFEALFQN